jgi:AcrR family transcriptional regulator
MTIRTGKRAPKQAAEVRRETVLEAAIRVFARTSYRAAGTAEIAREAGIAEPTIYRHFDSKRSLYLAALERCGAIVRDQFARIAERTPDAGQALDDMGKWYGQAMETDPVYLRLRQRSLAETDDPEVRAIVRGMYEEILTIVGDVIRRGQAEGSFSPAISPEGGAWLFIAIGHTMDLARLIGMTPEESDSGCHQMIDVAERALRTGASS